MELKVYLVKFMNEERGFLESSIHIVAHDEYEVKTIFYDWEHMRKDKGHYGSLILETITRVYKKDLDRHHPYHRFATKEEWYGEQIKHIYGGNK